MWEEVIAGRLSLCAMSSSTAKFRTRGELNMQRGELRCRRSAPVFPKLSVGQSAKMQRKQVCK